jgi:hypothetical protein
MKRTLLLFALAAILFPAVSQAQVPKVGLPTFDLGIKAGADFAQLNGGTWQQAYKPGVVAGIFVGLRKKRIGVQIEGLVNTATYHLKDSIKTGIRATYISIPILFEYKIIPFLWLQVGPQYSGAVSVTSLNGFVGDAGQVIKSGDFDGVLGLELKLPLHLDVGARYILGFSNENNGLFPGASDAWNNRSIQLHVGFTFL